MREWKEVIEEMIKNVDWLITVDGKKEFEHFFTDYMYILDFGTILPILNIKFGLYKDKGFDSNESSLLEYADEKGYRIITEDRPMILEGVTGNKNIIFLIDFFYELTENYEYFNTEELYHLIGLFRKWKNINKKKAESIE